MKTFQVITMACTFTGLLFVLQHSESLDSFVQHAKRHSVDTADSTPYTLGLFSAAAARMGQESRQEPAELLQQIRMEADKRKIAPVDARLDRVWKAIPGYNGLEVDIEKSLALNLQKPIPGKLRLEMRELTPSVQLEQLGSHPIYRGNPAKPMVSLMINVAWGDEFLPKMLDVLEKEQVHTTFFFDGSWLKKNISTAKLIKEKGHELSNHAYSHKDMSKLSRSQNYNEIVKTQQLLEQELGVNNQLFAPPSGDFSQITVDTARDLKLKTILWTLDTVDWRNPGASAIIRKISVQVEPGALILMHPTSSSSQALEQMIKVIKSKGLKLGTVSEVISSNRVPEVESVDQ